MINQRNQPGPATHVGRKAASDGSRTTPIGDIPLFSRNLPEC
ncbi:MAG: hypothetical protein Q7J09_06370 [Methanocalculus sp.]|nr:hypothetical protein [Methanocalculus sp.]